MTQIIPGSEAEMENITFTNMAARIKFDYPLHLWRNDSNQRQAFPENSDISLKHWLFHQLWPFVLWNKI